MKNADHKRRKVLNFSIMRNMQLRMLGRMGLTLAVSLFVCGLIYYFFADKEVSRSYMSFHIQAKNFLDWLLPVTLGALALGLLIGFLISLFFPKRIVGPLYRIEQSLDNMSEGDLSVHIELRKGDELDSLASRINALNEEMCRRLSFLRAQVKEASGILSAGDTAPPPDLDKVRELLARVAEGLDHYRLTKEQT